MLLLLLLVATTTQAFSFSGMYHKYMPPLFETKCNFTRIDALNCLSKYIDVDPKDGQITKKEAEEAIQKYVPPVIRGLFWGLVGTDRIWEACDYDKNGVITAKDWMMTKDHCMPHKKNMCSLEWFCKKGGFKPPRLETKK